MGFRLLQVSLLALLLLPAVAGADTGSSIDSNGLESDASWLWRTQRLLRATRQAVDHGDLQLSDSMARDLDRIEMELSVARQGLRRTGLGETANPSRSPATTPASLHHGLVRLIARHAGNLVLPLAGEMPRGSGEITGRVAEAGSGSLIADVEILIRDAAETYMISTTTDADGAFTSGTVLDTGDHFVAAFDDIHVSEIWDDIACINCGLTTGTPIPVTSGAATNGINFVLDVGGTIEGIVRDAVSGQLLEGVTISGYTEAGHGLNGGLTNADGRYVVAGLPSGVYFARTDFASGYVDELYDDLICFGWCEPSDGHPISVTLGAATTGIDFALDPGGGISGTLHYADASPVDFALVTLWCATGRHCGEGWVNPDGSWSTSAGFPPGAYFATSYNSDGWLDELYDSRQCPLGDCAVTAGTPIMVSSGAMTSGIEFVLDLGGQVAGTVTEAAGGTPLESGFIEIHDERGNTTTTSPGLGGVYASTEGLPSGRYFAVAQHFEGYLEELYDGIWYSMNLDVFSGEPIAVVAGVATEGIDFTLEEGGNVSGTITDEDSGQPLKDVLVDIISARGIFASTSRTAADGSYLTKPAIPLDAYYALTTNNTHHINEVYDDVPCLGGCNPADGLPFAVAPALTTSGIDLELRFGGVISGAVVAESPAPVDPVGRVLFYDAQGRLVTDAYTDSGGAYSSNGGLTPGVYFVRTNMLTTYIDELYDDIPCPNGDCQITSGTPVLVTGTATTPGVDFVLLFDRIFSDGFELGDTHSWSASVP